MVIRLQQYEARGEIVWHWQVSSTIGMKQGSAETLPDCMKAIYALEIPELEGDKIAAGLLDC